MSAPPLPLPGTSRRRSARSGASMVPTVVEDAMIAAIASRLPRPRGGHLLGVLLGLLFASPAFATCLPIAGKDPLLQPAAYQPASLPEAGTVRLTFLGHSSFLIETPGGASVVTDYNGVYRPPAPPAVVTMNNAHSTHYTDYPDPEIEHVLRGWDPAGGIAEHDLRYKDLRIRNVPTNVREWSGNTRYNGNSIFVFEVADLCVAHLGHLHHRLTDQHLGELGIIDVLLVPVDGSFTLDVDLMVEVIQQIRPAVVIPMHYFGQPTLANFLERVSESYEIVESGTPVLEISRLNLPWAKVVVLPGT
jgi:L-ascorbate metabolism protein UlaG (beta-lactamase superfamily)